MCSKGSTPVAVSVFNRPEKTKQVYEAVAKYQPEKLLVVADGPRVDNPDDPRLCREVRSIFENVGWDCSVYRNYAEENLGLRKRISSGLDWVFDRVGEAIILEDDCVPHQSFFPFCERMLDEYRGDERICDVTGHNPLGKWRAKERDYHFSHFGGIWGWATWSDSWAKYDVEMSAWEDEDVKQCIRDVWCDQDMFEHYGRIFDLSKAGIIQTWDYQWAIARATNNALSVVPSKNLIKNIGFDESATNTTSKNREDRQHKRHGIDMPVELNELIAPDRDYDEKVFRNRTKWYQRLHSYRRLRDLYCRFVRGYPKVSVY